MDAEEYLAKKGLAGVGHYGLLATNTSGSYMHEIMEGYAKQENASLTKELQEAREELSSAQSENERLRGFIKKFRNCPDRRLSYEELKFEAIELLSEERKGE